MPDDTAHEEARCFWDALGVSKSEHFNIVCIGSMTARRFEMPTVIAAARELQRGSSRAKFVLAGAGDDLQNYRKLARGCENVIFPGWLNAAQIRVLLSRAHLGLVPYRGTPDLLMSVPNKVGEYLAAGVPVATCLHGTLARMLSERGCGMLFEASQPDSLVALVRQMQDDAGLCDRLSVNAVTAYRDELDSGTVYGRLIARLETIAAQYSHNRSEPSVERVGLGV
jgi:glycosyltransferase involved in cell wall biosynthesis